MSYSLVIDYAYPLKRDKPTLRGPRLEMRRLTPKGYNESDLDDMGLPPVVYVQLTRDPSTGKEVESFYSVPNGGRELFYWSPATQPALNNDWAPAENGPLFQYSIGPGGQRRDGRIAKIVDEGVPKRLRIAMVSL